MPARLFLCLFDRIPEYLTRLFDALLVSVGVHPQRYGFVRVAQLF